MKKILIFLLTVCLVAWGGVVAFADETGAVQDEAVLETATPSTIITELYAYTSKLFYCDSSANKIVLKSVTPSIEGVGAEAIAQLAEYTEISISPDGLFMENGEKLKTDELNLYVDKAVWVIIAKTEGRCLSVPYLKFLPQNNQRGD